MQFTKQLTLTRKVLVVETSKSGCRIPKIKPFTPDSAKSKIDKFLKMTIWVKFKNKQHHSKVLLNSFPLNGQTKGFCPYDQGFILGVKGLTNLSVQ